MPQWLNDLLPFLAPVGMAISWFLGRRQARANTAAQMSEKFDNMASNSIDQTDRLYTQVGTLYDELLSIKGELHTTIQERDDARRELDSIKGSKE